VPLSTFGATVTSVACVPADGAVDGDGEDRWAVKWTTRGGGAHSETFDAVLVANGHYDAPYKPRLPGEEEWLAGDPSRQLVHSREYDDPESFRGQSVLVVGGRSSGVDIARELRGVATWVYVLEKKCQQPVTHPGEAVTHVPLGTRLCGDGQLRVGDAPDAPPVDGPAIERVVLATGYVYDFAFLDEADCELRFKGQRHVTPLYQHMLHARKPSLGFVGITLAVPCPIPYFECQAAWIAEHWARPSNGAGALTSQAQREEWVAKRWAAVAERSQDMLLTSADGGSAWAYMRELLRDVHAVVPPTADADSWLARPGWEERLTTVESVYSDRGARYPKLPWEDDRYRRCEYEVDWASGTWSVDDSQAA